MHILDEEYENGRGEMVELLLKTICFDASINVVLSSKRTRMEITANLLDESYENGQDEALFCPRR